MTDIKDLKFYAQQIQERKIEILEIKRRIAANRKSLASIDLALAQEIAFNEALKNEAQRRTAKEALISSDDTYLFLAGEIEKDSFEIERLDIALEYWRHQLSIGKLEIRERLTEIGMVAL